MKIHIQHVLLSLQPGGLENGVVNVVNRLAPDQFQSSICCLKHAGEFAARVNPGTSIYEMGWKGGNDLQLPFRLARLFRKTRPDIVHTRNAESFYYGFLGAKLAGINCIVHSEHGRTFNDRAIRFRVQRWFSAYTHAMFAVTKELRGELVKHIGIPGERIQVLYNGVDLERFSANGRHEERNEVRHTLGLSDSAVVIGSVGRLVPVKNYSLLLKAVKALGRADVVVMLVGEGKARTDLEALAKSLGINQQVRLLGHRDDVTSLLTAMDIFVLPSLNEGMSNTLLEAMASGIPSVASDIGGNPEIIADERNGFLFANNDEHALATCLQRLCSDSQLRTRIGQAGREHIANEFSIQAMIARYENLYRTTVAHSNGRGK
jgi:sugar transferase (PEP-CTERM/EpsH1 system associated)